MNTKKTILDRAIDALEDYLNAGHKELRRQAAEKAKKVYEDYYGTPYKNREEVKASLKKEDRIYVPDSIKVLIDGAGILNGSKQLHYSHSFNDWFVIRKPSGSILMQRPYLEKVEELEVGKVYFVKWVSDAIKDLRTSYLQSYGIYLGGDKFVMWVGRCVSELGLIVKHHDCYEVKDENN